MSRLTLLNGIAAANGAPTAVTTVASITTVAGANLVDGERVLVADGLKIQIVEFDTDGSLTEAAALVNAVRVAVGGLTADQVRDALITAINGAGLDVVATNGGAATVTITANRPGANTITISETVVDAGFAVAITTAGSLSGVRVATTRAEILALEAWTTGAAAPVNITLTLWAYNWSVGRWLKTLGFPDAALAANVGNDARRFEVMPAGMEIPDLLYLEAAGAFNGSSLYAQLQGRMQRRTA
jgi:hypothetical protein